VGDFGEGEGDVKIRKILVGAALALGIGLVATPAVAQDAGDSPASVLPLVIQPEVKGVTLAKTGSDIDAELLAGIGLTAAGAALAVTARQRRRRFAESGT
jgi:LPXTG-motif cell wall-anchored protein